MVPFLHRVPRLNRALGCLFYSGAFLSGFLNAVGGKQGWRDSGKKSQRKRKKQGIKKWEQEEVRLPKKARITYYLCHHLASLCLFNLSVAVWKVKGERAQIPRSLPQPCLSDTSSLLLMTSVSPYGGQ